MAPCALFTISAAIADRASWLANAATAAMPWCARSTAGFTISMVHCAAPRALKPIHRSTRTEFGLRHVEMEIWNGLVFVRFKPGPQPAVAELLKPFDAEVGSYRAGDMVPAGAVWASDLAVNWKSVRDVDNEGYHVAMAHPALQDLYGYTYRDYHMAGGINVSKGTFLPHGGRRWSVRNYLKSAGGPDWLPEDLKNVWSYYGIFPNNVIITTPETVQFYQELPLDVGHARVRGMAYRRPDEDRRQRLARYLTYRIDRETYAEDTQLSMWSNESMKSSAFEGFYLSDMEHLVRAHHDRLRIMLPVMTLDQPPPDSEMAAINAAMKAETQSAMKAH